MPGTLFVVATRSATSKTSRPGVARAARGLCHRGEDTRRTAHLLARYGIVTRTTSLHEHNEAKKSAALVERLKRGDDIALVSDAGTRQYPTRRRLVGAAIESGARVESIPGPSAALTALVASGSHRIPFFSWDFHRLTLKTATMVRALTSAGRTVVFFEAPHRIRRTLEELREKVGDCRVAIGRELTKAHEELVRGPISAVLTSLEHPKGNSRWWQILVI